MDEVITAIRRAIIDEEETGEMISTSIFAEEAKAKPTPEAGLLSREATAAVGSAFNTLTETVKKHEPTLEDVVRETLRPVLKSWLDENLPRVVERMVQSEIERVARGR
jgi:cell pole-organizing protein PopZ